MDLRATNAEWMAQTISAGAPTGGALPPLDGETMRDLDKDADDDVAATSAVAPLSLRAAAVELLATARTLTATNDNAGALTPDQFFYLLVHTRSNIDAQTLIAHSGISASVDRASAPVNLVSVKVFAAAAHHDTLVTERARIATAVAAAPLLRFVVVASPHAPRVLDTTGLVTSLRALHVSVGSTSAVRECVATLQHFAALAFNTKPHLAQFLFGPLVYFAREQYELGAASGDILGSTRAVVDLIARLAAQVTHERAVAQLVHDGSASLSTVQLPMEPLAFLTDVASALHGSKPWPAIHALTPAGGATDDVDVASVKRSGDGLAWHAVEPRKTKTDQREELHSGNLPGAKTELTRLEGCTLYVGPPRARSCAPSHAPSTSRQRSRTKACASRSGGPPSRRATCNACAARSSHARCSRRTRLPTTASPSSTTARTSVMDGQAPESATSAAARSTRPKT